MKIYLAATYSRNAEMRGVRDQLQTLGLQVTSRWIDQHGGHVPESIVAEKLNASPVECYPYAEADVTDLKAADTVISFTSADGGGQGGRHVEFGLAIGLGKRLIIVGPSEHVFHTLPQVERYATLSELVTAWSGGHFQVTRSGPEAGGSMNPTPDCGGPRKPPGANAADDAFITHARTDLPRLLKMAEAVALHQPGPFAVLGALCKEHEVFRHFSITSAEADRARACPECAAVICVSCTCGQPDREHCPTYRAIAGELLTEEDDRG